jgi:hypothetical protein
LFGFICAAAWGVCSSQYIGIVVTCGMGAPRRWFATEEADDVQTLFTHKLDTDFFTVTAPELPVYFSTAGVCKWRIVQEGLSIHPDTIVWSLCLDLFAQQHGCMSV